MSATSKPAAKPLLALALMCLLLGYNWVAMKIALRHAGVYDFTALRVLASTAILFVIAIALRRPIRLRTWRPAVVVGAIQTGGFLLCSMWALSLGGAARTSVLVFTMPFWTLIFSRFVLHERLRGVQWIAVALAFCGLTLIVAPWEMRDATAANIGASFAAIAAGMLWALGTVLSKKLVAKDSVDLLSFTAWQMLVATMPLLVAAWLVPSRPMDWSSEFVVYFTFATIFGTVIGWLLWSYVLNHIEAGVASLNSLAIPVIAVASAWLQLGERPPAHELGGMLLIGIALVLLGTRPRNF